MVALRLGSGLYPQIEIFDDPSFYNKLRSKLQGSEVEISLPLHKMESIPQIIEICSNILLAINILIEIYKLTNPKPSVQIRTRENKIMELKTKNIDELLLWAEEKNE